MTTIFDAATYESLRERAGRLTPESPRQWGRMTPHQAVCHLNDSFLIVLGDRTTDFRANSLFNRTVARFLALSTPVPWPKGVPTSPEADQERKGTPPGAFDEDVAQLRDLMARFRETEGRSLDPHIAFGPLTSGEWGRWGYRHMNHHLSQFGV
jgi:hypothetical protein